MKKRKEKEQKMKEKQKKKEVLIKSFYNCDNENEFITEIQLPIIEM